MTRQERPTDSRAVTIAASRSSGFNQPHHAALAWHAVSRYNFRMKKNGNGLLLDRILEPVSSSLNEEAAQKLLTLKADRETQARVSKLADKCTEDELTPEERHEYEQYLMANHFIAVLKAKARILLARKGRPV